MYDLEFSNKTQMFFEVVLHYHKSKGKLTEAGVRRAYKAKVFVSHIPMG